MPYYIQSIDRCLEPVAGGGGLTDAALQTALAAMAPHMARLKSAYADGSIALLRVPEADDDIVAAEQALARLSEGADTIQFFGTGGSSLGGQTLAQLGGWDIPGEFRPGQMQRPRARFQDNLDPRTLAKVLAQSDARRTRFVVISKSGGTAETLTQTIATIAMLREQGLEQDLPRLMLGITEPAHVGKRNGLRALLHQFGIPMLEHHPGVGGRYSALTIVGLLPAMTMGVDPRAVRAGARAVMDSFLEASSAADAPPALGAALMTAFEATKHARVAVMMAYSDRLARFTHWFVQLWAESLGKAGRGMQPVAALGPVDQHSQLQLFMEGPADKIYTVIRMREYEPGPRLDPELARIAGMEDMADRTAGDLVTAQSHAVPEALSAAGRPVRTFDLPALEDATLGALMMHFMLETILAGWRMGIDPFDQPGVEAGKRLVRNRLIASRRA